MKKLSIVIMAVILSSYTGSAEARDVCGDYGDACMEDCNTYYTGDTAWDGAGRLWCRAECEISEAFCRYGEFLVNTF
ncbi:hypothetical protein [Gracilimonas sp.]|uniref:hypothetical protein n=1 Tax=Gracilimonas sp. TaxID=1974203 RepID=UPI003BAC6D2D